MTTIIVPDTDRGSLPVLVVTHLAAAAIIVPTLADCRRRGPRQGQAATAAPRR